VKQTAGSIFISYRREHTQGEAGHLLADLRRHFGDERVFFDVATIRPGEDFRMAVAVDANVKRAMGDASLLPTLADVATDSQGAQERRCHREQGWTVRERGSPPG
jgi:hypothetical protein